MSFPYREQGVSVPAESKGAPTESKGYTLRCSGDFLCGYLRGCRGEEEKPDLERVVVKGAVSRHSVIFCAFLREQTMAVARSSVADIRPESLAILATWQPGHQCWPADDMTVP